MSDLNRFLPKKKEITATNKSKSLKNKKKIPKIINRGEYPPSLDQLSKEKLISLLEPLMAELPGFVANLAWTRQKILPQNRQIHPKELVQILNIPLLEAYLILDQLRSNQDSFVSD